MEVSLLGDVTHRAAELWGRRTALFFKDRRHSYIDLRNGSLAVSEILAGLGVGNGQRVAIYMENRPEYLHAYFGAPSTGATVVPLNTFLSPEEIGRLLSGCGAVVLFCSDGTLERIAPLLQTLPALRHLVLCDDGRSGSGRAAVPTRVSLTLMTNTPVDPVSRRPRHPPVELTPDDTVAIICTSGTTGEPRGVMLSHANLLANARACIEAVGLNDRDRVLLCLPMFHSFTETVCMLAPMLAGIGIVLCTRIDRAEVKRAIMRRRPTIFPAVPAVFAAMSRVKLSSLARWLNPVRLYISGGAPLSLQVLQEFEKRYRRPLCEGYGLSEASPVVSLNPPAGPRKPGSVGLPLPGLLVRTVNASGGEVVSGQIGELLVRGPSVMKGYDRRPEESADVLRDGWLRTGDMARLDEDGYIFIAGRCKELLIYRGMNVYPREIEAALEAHPTVHEAAVVGIPDEKRGEVPCAFVVPREGSAISESDLRHACLTSLARYKVPRLFRVVDSLPRNPAGKVLKQVLKEQLLAPGQPVADSRRPARAMRPGM